MMNSYLFGMIIIVSNLLFCFAYDHHNIFHYFDLILLSFHHNPTDISLSLGSLVYLHSPSHLSRIHLDKQAYNCELSMAFDGTFHSREFEVSHFDALGCRNGNNWDVGPSYWDSGDSHFGLAKSCNDNQEIGYNQGENFVDNLGVDYYSFDYRAYPEAFHNFGCDTYCPDFH